MAEETGYNGWANYPTWVVALWINNDQGWQGTVHETLRDENRDLIDKDPNGEPMSAYRAGEIVRENVEEIIYAGDDDPTPDRGRIGGLARDLIGWALDSADWDEIGAAFLADVAEADTYQEA